MTRNKTIQDSTKACALVFLNAMNDATKVVHAHDFQAQHFLECIRDELAPQLKWAFRYGEWQLDAAPFVTDDAPTDPDIGFDELDSEPE